ncbi:hypothetical protein AB1K84_08560 [Mesobacillus foraminis]|uniref:DMP19 family protein n=1 Tax=Mesobacillus foraminis TaxID=279826 RepID=UPI0039A25121
MKPKMKQSELLDRDDIWNAVINVVCDHDYPSEDKLLNETFIVFQFYSELESGGHESLITWFSEYIENIGINCFANELVGILKKIGAHEYAEIENKYIQGIWEKYSGLEKGEIGEEEFYSLVERADSEYHQLDSKLQASLEAYFISIHRDLIDVGEG